MSPLYSILINDPQGTAVHKVGPWLHKGIKVIYFGLKESIEALKNQWSEYASAMLLLTYESVWQEEVCFQDGVGADSFVHEMETRCPMFNGAQYLVEHGAMDHHMVVQASAGTGKTKVMVDRILYLMHMDPDLTMDQIYMITFTKDAAAQMNQRLQDALLIRYQLTGEIRYLQWLEQQSGMSISTIHSFCLMLLKKLGLGESFTSGLVLRSFEGDKEELIRAYLDECYRDGKSVMGQLGLPYEETVNLIKRFWQNLMTMGISHEDLKRLDWGEAKDAASIPFQHVLAHGMEQLDEAYMERKRREEAVDVNDIIRDLQDILDRGYVPANDFRIRYLFIDEFQDSDLAQISVAYDMIRIFNAVLFVVGDEKQSIYRFRGATDQAFDLLESMFSKESLGSVDHFNLINNYRTAGGILRRLDQYFLLWGEYGLLRYSRSVVPVRAKEGTMKMVPCEEGDTFGDQVAELVRREQINLKQRLKEQGRKAGHKDRVVILTRSNHQLSEIAAILRAHDIAVFVQKDGSFYESRAVKDFYHMIGSYLYCDEPKYIWNYLMTPYAGLKETMDIHAMERLHGDYEDLVSYLDYFLNQTTWKDYHRKLRLRPLLSVLKEMVDTEPVLARVTHRKQSYEANLGKLMNILQENFGHGNVSLYDIYTFLQKNMAFNRAESEAKVESAENLEAVLCMTVHRSKGLEFDTVIIPYTNQPFPVWDQTEILLNPETLQAGWNYRGDQTKNNRRFMKNTHYDNCKYMDMEAVSREECRILYVAMTRAIHTLICLVPPPRNIRTWAAMIEEVEMDE